MQFSLIHSSSAVVGTVWEAGPIKALLARDCIKDLNIWITIPYMYKHTHIPS